MILQQLLPDSTLTLAADLVIDGLGICCFDRRDRNHPHWEVAYLRDEHHQFELSVTEKTLGGAEVHHYPDQTLDDLKTISVIVNGGSNAHYTQYPEGYYQVPTRFERDINGDRKDFRWVIDFISNSPEVEHGDFIGLKQHQVPVTLLEVPNSLFYTKALTTSPAIYSPRAHVDPCEASVLGHTNALVGAIVLTNGPSRVIIQGRDRHDNMLIIKDLEYKENQYYEIGFTNMDRLKVEAHDNKGIRAASPDRGKLKDYEKGDFERFYEVIGVVGTEKSLWGRRHMEHGRLGDCHVVMVDSTIQTLEPLLD